MFKVFNTNKELDKTLSQRITALEETVIVLKAQINGLELENDSLRNKVLRKIQYKQTDEEQTKIYKAGQKVRL